MKFLLDENLSFRLADPLRAVYKLHEFRSVHEESLEGTLDLELFAVAKERGFNAIITRDRMQRRNEDERRALFEHGLHWIALATKDHKGLTGIALASSALVASLDFIIREWESEPHLYTVKGKESQATQLFSKKPVRMDKWEGSVPRTG